MTKQELGMYRRLWAELKRHRTRIEDIRSSIDELHRAMEMGREPPGAALAAAEKQLHELVEHHKQELIQCNLEMLEIENVIRTLADWRQRKVLSMRYLDGVKDWERIGESIGYSARHAQRIHDAAIAEMNRKE